SYGARALGGPEGDGIVNINNASIVTLSPDSYGVLAGGSIGTVAASGIVNLNAAHVEVRGAGTNAAGTVSGGTLKASNGTTLVALNGNAIEATNNGTLVLNGTTTESSGATIQSNLNAAN